MTVLNKLASSLKRRDEEPNLELAKEIAGSNDKKAIAELIVSLNSKNKGIQNDCIKVIYEIGELKPALISPYIKEFAALLKSGNNRLQWGAMTALDSITTANPALIYNVLGEIISAADQGSVITKDHCVNILIKLYGVKDYAKNSFTLLLEQLLKSLPNQLPKYAEDSAFLITENNKKQFIQVLSSRLSDIEKDTKRKRVEKVIKKISAI